MRMERNALTEPTNYSQLTLKHYLFCLHESVSSSASALSGFGS